MELYAASVKNLLLISLLTIVNVGGSAFCQTTEKFKLELKDTLIASMAYKKAVFQNLDFQINTKKLELSSNKSLLSFKVSKNGATSDADVLDSHLEYRVNDPIRVGYRPIRVDKIDATGNFMSISVLKDDKTSLLGYRKGEVLDKLNLKTIDNKVFVNRVDNASFYLYNFWGSWCSPCLKSMRKLGLFSKTDIAKTFKIVTIAKDYEEQNVLKTINDLHTDWTNIYEPFSEKEGVIKKLNVVEFPTIIVTDNKGLILFRGNDFDEF